MLRHWKYLKVNRMTKLFNTLKQVPQNALNFKAFSFTYLDIRHCQLSFFIKFKQHIMTWLFHIIQNYVGKNKA